MVTSRLDYCNSLLFWTSANNIGRLQRLQNAATRLVTRQTRHECVLPILRQLHWLPIQQRITFKIAVLMYKVLHEDLSPVYTQKLICIYKPARCLRSADSSTLVVPRSCSRAGDYTFVQVVAAVWNALPSSVLCKTSLNSHKSALKTHLFTAVYV